MAKPDLLIFAPPVIEIELSVMSSAVAIVYSVPPAAFVPSVTVTFLPAIVVLCFAAAFSWATLTASVSFVPAARPVS